MIPELLEIATIHAAYRAGTLTPLQLVTALLARIAEYPDKAVFISRPPDEHIIAQATALDVANMEQLPLFGIPFVVKDNIDVAGLPTVIPPFLTGFCGRIHAASFSF
jgi:allophanate hydrolase